VGAGGAGAGGADAVAGDAGGRGTLRGGRGHALGGGLGSRAAAVAASCVRESAAGLVEALVQVCTSSLRPHTLVA
jgi:hypothetical protein